METEGWLPLTNYSSKYGVSISTLRRRIKGETIRFQIVHGKYLIPDQPFGEIEQDLRGEEADFSTANMLLQEIRQAYSGLLEEKDKQIASLRNEIADLNTLVRALERDNERLSSIAGPSKGRPGLSL